MTYQWHHHVALEVRTTPEDFEEFHIQLLVSGYPGSPATFNKAQGQWDPPEPAELELLDVFFLDPSSPRARYTRALPANPLMFDSGDQNVLDAVDVWWDDHADECWESLSEECDR